jgi:hypothetical protein
MDESSLYPVVIVAVLVYYALMAVVVARIRGRR